jgi:hypothetical protein
VTQITRLGSARASAGKFLHESGQVRSGQVDSGRFVIKIAKTRMKIVNRKSLCWETISSDRKVQTFAVRN